LALAACLCAALVLGCSPSGGSDDPEDQDHGGTGTIEEASELFVESTTEPGLFKFETNDDAYISDRGFTLWALKAAAQDPFVSRTVVLNKSGGDAWAGYGIVFCHHAAAEGESMLVVMIDRQGEYIVGEATGSVFTAIVPWTTSTSLKQGLNQDNKIAVRLDASTFTLSINDVDVKTFSAIETDYELGGDNGYLVVISPWDKFPGTPVKVSFKEE
jgi:hypothetical protein